MDLSLRSSGVNQGVGLGIGDRFGDQWSNRVQAEGEGAVVALHQAVDSVVRGVGSKVGCYGVSICFM